MQGILGHPNDPADFLAPCVSPIEIAGDKLSALAWKIHNPEKYEKQVMRHLHDLAWLKDLIVQSPEDFERMTIESFQNDQKRWADNLKQLSIREKIQSTIVMLEDSSKFCGDYREYVSEFSYKKDDEKISYEDSLENLRYIISLF